MAHQTGYGSPETSRLEDMDDPTGGLVKLGEKTLGSIEKGITSLTKPWTTRREGQAGLELRKKELLMLEQTRQDIEDVRLGKKAINERFEIVPLNPTPDERLTFPSAEEWEESSDTAFGQLASFATKEKTLQDMEQAINLRQIAIRVEEELQDVGDEEVGEKQVDWDWFTKWRTYAQDTSSEQLQNLWAKLLVGENRRPGSYSLHTLELLSRLSKEDAELIAKVFKFRFDSGIPKLGNFPLYEMNGVAFDGLIHLEAIGILLGVTASVVRLGLTYDRDESGRPTEVIKYEKYAIRFYGQSESDVQTDCYLVSQAGMEIASLIPINNNIDDLTEIAKYILKGISDQHINLQVVEVIYGEDGTSSYQRVRDVTRNDLSPTPE